MSVVLFISTGLFLDRNFWQLAFLLVTLQIGFSFISKVSYEAIVNYSNIFLAAYGYFTILDSYKGQTLGKYVFKIRVVKIDGGKLGILDSAVRNIGKVFLLILDVPLGLLFYMKQGYIKFFDYYTKSKIEKIV